VARRSAPGIAGGPLNKKLLEPPPGCQESSGPIKNTGPVMANSIAIEISV